MDEKAVPAPGTPTTWRRFRGGFIQEWKGDSSLCPFCWVIGRIALGLLVLGLVGVAVLGMLAAVLG